MGIRITENAAPHVVGNTCAGNTLSGVVVRDAAQPTIENNAFQDNVESGIAYFNTSGGALRNNQITGNTLNGVSINDQAQPTIEGNAITDNTAAGLSYFDQGAGSAQGNTITGNKWGIYVEATANPTLGANAISNNATDVDDRRTPQ